MKRKILVLEDEENIRSFLVLNLKRSGYEVIKKFIRTVQQLFFVQKTA